MFNSQKKNICQSGKPGTISREQFTMTRKHFIELAMALSWIRDETERSRIAAAVADVCSKSNPRFDRSKFLSSVGVK